MSLSLPRPLALLSLGLLLGCYQSLVTGEVGDPAPTPGDAGETEDETAPEALCPSGCQDRSFDTAGEAIADCDCCPSRWWDRGSAERYEPASSDVRLSVELEAGFDALGATLVVVEWRRAEAAADGARIVLGLPEDVELRFVLPGAEASALGWLDAGRRLRLEVEPADDPFSTRPRTVLRLVDPSDESLVVAARDDEVAGPLGAAERELGAGAVLNPNERATCTAAPSECWTFGVHGAELSYAGGRAVVEAGETGTLAVPGGPSYAFRASYRLRCCARGQCADTSYTGQGAGWMIRTSP